MKITVYYEDTDIGGVVYHANYLKYCDRARTALFLDSNINIVIDDTHFLVKSIECDYKSSATLGDILDVKNSILDVKKASFTILQKIYKNNILIFEATLVLAYVKDGIPKKIPKDIINFLTLQR